MAYTTIDDSSAHFHTQLYTGTGSSHSVTNDANAGDFKPDWVWLKERSSSGGHKIYDSTRGVQEAIQAQSSAGETTTAQGLTAFNTDGFTVGSDGGHNQSSATYVAWQWKCNGGTTASNTDGNVTSTVQVNSTAGFSMVAWTGNGGTSVNDYDGTDKTDDFFTGGVGFNIPLGRKANYNNCDRVLAIVEAEKFIQMVSSLQDLGVIGEDEVKEVINNYLVTTEKKLGIDLLSSILSLIHISEPTRLLSIAVGVLWL